MRREIELIRTLALLFAAVTQCRGQTPRDIAQTAFRSVVLLSMADSAGQPLAYGSGFFATEDIIVTNAHVIEGASSGTAKLVGDASTLPILGVLAIDRRADLALLQVTRRPGQHSHLSLRDDLAGDPRPEVGDHVYVVGNPLGLEGTFSEGIVSGIRVIGNDSVLQMTAPISPGSSGGPVMDDSGSVIGISVAQFKDGQNLNLAVPVAYLNKLLNSSLHLTPIGPSTKASTVEHSILDELGTKSEAGVIASDFAWDDRHLGGCYQFRLTNKLPVTVSRVRLYVIFRDASSTVVNFDEPKSGIDAKIPPGLTKTILECSSDITIENLYQQHVYSSRKKNAPPDPKVEFRVATFSTEQP